MSSRLGAAEPPQGGAPLPERPPNKAFGVVTAGTCTGKLQANLPCAMLHGITI